MFSVNGVVPNLALVVVVAAVDRARHRSSAPWSASPPACCSTSARRPTTSPAVGRSPWCSWPSSPAGCARTLARSPLAGLPTVAVCSFVATSVFALSGVVLGDQAVAGRRDRAGHRHRGAVGRRGRAAAAAGADGALRAHPPDRTGVLTMAAVLIRPTASERSRLRLLVVQALVLALFVTLFARLWYMQVLTGESYQAQAAEQSVRDVVVQPARGLIVDDQGRPLVANRSTWVVSIDRTLLGKLSEAEREATLRKLAKAVDVPRAEIKAPDPAVRSAGRQVRNVLERLAVPAGAGGPRRPAEDRGQGAGAVRGLPRRAGAAGERARLPLAVRRQRRPRARLPEPDHRGRARRGEEGRRHHGQRRLGGRPRRRRAGLRPLAARRARPQDGRRGLDGSGPGGLRRGRVRAPATPWSPRSTPRSRDSWRSSSTRRSRPPGRPPTR